MNAGNKKKPDWLQNGSYTQLAGEKEFFELSKQYANIVLLFHRTGDQQCRIMDTHLTLLAAKHLEAKFCKINIEDAKFLQQRLRINHTPEILLVKDRMTTDYIVGFQELGGNCDSFSTAMLERRIARSGTISYKGKQKKTCTHYTQST